MADDATAKVSTAEAWDEFCDLLKKAGDVIRRKELETSTFDRAEGLRYLGRLLQAGLDSFGENPGPEYPYFRTMGRNVKMGLDNPDNFYVSSSVNGAYTYRIRGNVHGACYTAFSVETGAQEGHLSKGVISTLNDSEFDIAADGSYEIIASPDAQPRNWLRLEPGAGSITTRHYWEWERSVAADPTFHVPLWIEPVENPGPALWALVRVGLATTGLAALALIVALVKSFVARTFQIASDIA